MAQQTFRSALNGFNRDDVVRYIEFLNSSHAAEINQLNSELVFLRERSLKEEARAKAEPEAVVNNSAQMEQQAARIRELFDRCTELEEKLAVAESAKIQAEEKLVAAESAKTQAEEKLVAAEEAKAHAEEKLQAVLTQQNHFSSRAGEELEAYRRAERIERLARERAEQLYQQSNGALADASVKVDDAAGRIGQLSDLVMEQLAQLQDAVSGTKQAMKEAAQIMYSIRPEAEN